MVCKDCREAGMAALQVILAPQLFGMGALTSAMRGHEKCKSGTWCDCAHKAPVK